MKSSTRVRSIALAALGLAAVVPLILLVWSLAERLLNARSDLSVLLGLGLIALTLILAGLAVYVLLDRWLRAGETADSREEESKRFGEGAEPKSLFPAPIANLEKNYERERSKHHRE